MLNILANSFMIASGFEPRDQAVSHRRRRPAPVRWIGLPWLRRRND
ncbi:hypothetical protein [uncultured Amaricoccus sp.]|nr:hypothetical protein [uncultured Amaricoccus sp.]